MCGYIDWCAWTAEGIIGAFFAWFLLHSVKKMPPCAPISIWRLGPETLASFAALPSSRLAMAQAVLSLEERRRAAAFHADEDRLLYSASHVALRIVLGQILGISPERLEFTGDGKPALFGLPTVSPPLRFNLAHTRGAVLIAAAAGCEVGVDIEQHRAIEDVESLVRTIASP